MAVHKYRCWKCKRDFPIEQRTNAKELDVWCPQCRKDGRETKLFRVREVHGLQTDSVFMSGSHVDDGFGTDNRSRQYALALARKAGVSTAGRRYCPSLARYKGDPRAWVDGRGHVKDVCIAEGWGCEGDVNIPKPEDDAPDPLEGKYEVADEVVDRHLKEQLAKIGEPISATEQQDMRESLKSRLSGGQD